MYKYVCMYGCTSVNEIDRNNGKTYGWYNIIFGCLNITIDINLLMFQRFMRTKWD